MDIIVRPPGTFYWLNEAYRCALGRSGIISDKSEGDGGTPIGRFPLRQVFFRADRIPIPKTTLPIRALERYDGWCDDPNSTSYNTLVRLPFLNQHEVLWRDDSIYDVVVELGYNDAPVITGKGSAIFLHVAKLGYSPTEGCVALSLEDLLSVLKTATPETQLVVRPD